MNEVHAAAITITVWACIGNNLVVFMNRFYVLIPAQRPWLYIETRIILSTYLTPALLPNLHEFQSFYDFYLGGD